MNKQDFSLKPILFDQREAFEIWHDRFVNEYNRSQQERQGYQLKLGTPLEHWRESFEHDAIPYWIQYRGRNIGFVTIQHITIGKYYASLNPLKIISDVYIDPKFRGRGLLAYVLLAFRQQDIDTVLLDKLRLKDHAIYYYNLDFRFACHWLEQELILLSSSPHDEFKPIWDNILVRLGESTVDK